MPTASFGLNTKNRPWSQSFGDPVRTLIAERLEDVVPLIDSANEAALSGQYVALLITYEAAPAFDPKLIAHKKSQLPLAWAATFEKPVAPDDKTESYCTGDWEPKITRASYSEAVKKIHEHIADGNTYQVNYTFPLTSSFEGDSFSWYRDLAAAQGADYCAFLNLGRFQVLSISPELFFERTGNEVKTKPMKGTARRGRFLSEDQSLARWLRNSEKDQAENVMIVDLLRNDLGKVSKTGSVIVTELFELEKFETVWQLTSTIKSKLTSGTNLTELMRALFPCGSITGAPKISTTKIINELEPCPRGAYTGAIGLIQPGGDCTFNVAIRTVVVDSTKNIATFGVGGGITIDSTPEREYDECIVKSRFLTTRKSSFELFESILIENGEPYLIERHLDRFRTSAEFFSFQYDEQKIRDRIYSALADRKTAASKMRVTLAPDGASHVSLSPIKLPDKELRRVQLADRAVNSFDGTLFHKTTNREFYSAQLAAHAGCDDVIFWNERGEVTESTIANIVVPLEGKLVTPMVDAGLLAGTFRAQLLAENKITEGVITVEQLKIAREFFLINSVRRWMKATLNCS